MKYSFEAFERSGKVVRGTVEAGSEGEATEKLRVQGLFVSTLTDARASVRRAGARMSSVKRLRALSMVTRQMSLLIATGTTVVEALRAVERQVKDAKVRATLSQVRTKVEEGAGLCEAMMAHPELFDPVSCSLIQAGESGGTMETMLDRLAGLARQQEKLVSSVIGAMVYPALLIVVSVAVLILMLTFVLPRFTDMFDALDAPLPATTQMLMSLSGVLRSYWFVIVPGLGVLGFGAWRFSQSDRGRAVVGRWALRLPVVGKIAISLIVARMVRLLGVLVDAKVPLLDALSLTRASVSSGHFAGLLDRASEAVSSGETLASAFERDELVPSSVSESIGNGERSGRLGAVLTSLAEFMDEDNDVVVRSLSSIIEPAILVVLGVVVGFVAISMFLPLFDLTTMTQGGPKQ